MVANQIEKYGYNWPLPDFDEPLKIEMECIRSGIGNGLPYHYEQMRRLIWPELDTHRWHELCVKEIPVNKVTVLMGPKSTGKTHEMAWYGLCKYFVRPSDTCVMVSSTDIRGLKLRVWGEITMLWSKAIERFDWLPGHHLESRLAITTDQLDDGDLEGRTVRDMRKGIIGIPCIQGNKFVGLGKYQGVKQKHVLLIADELALMGPSFLGSFSNLDGNEDFQAVCAFNPIDPLDQGGKAAEPLDGWSKYMSPSKTVVWDTNFMRGRCINLIGTDTPNNDYPGEKAHFKYLLSDYQIQSTKQAFGEESIEYHSQCKGWMKISQLSFRVLNRELCEKGNAFEDVIWEGSPRIHIAGLDSAWGGDRCVFTHVEFGKDVSGNTVLRCSPPEIIPFNPSPGQEADYAIAEWCKQRCEDLDIPPENFFHDSTGRGSLGTALARVWSAQCNPVEFGGQPTQRPVTSDYYWNDPKTGERRLKLCSEHYSKFVTELWFSVRYCVEAGQLRNLVPEVFDEFALRIWRRVKDDRTEIEPKSGTQEKPGMKQRTGRSPDLADSLAIAVEGARRRGFTISKLENSEAVQTKNTWLREIAEEHRAFVRKGQLVEV